MWICHNIMFIIQYDMLLCSNNDTSKGIVKRFDVGTARILYIPSPPSSRR